MPTPSNLLPPETSIGPVALTVPDLDRSQHFYQDILGLQPGNPRGTILDMQAGVQPIVTLYVDPSAPPPPLHATGLYHMAIRVPSRLDFARTLRHLANSGWRIEGAADHGVSEALYLSDPDQNGIEIYHDRPRESWPRSSSGSIQMGTDPLDVDGVLGLLEKKGGEWNGMAPKTVMGHVHLKVSNIPSSVAFYCDVLGFELQQRYGSAAAFVSAGGYHHHIGMNTWESAAGPTSEPGSRGLRHFTIRLPDQASLEQALARVEAAGQPVQKDPQGYLLHDPAGNHILMI
ncbi:MAG TPA: VOC family protein [Anaerolineales bacterium]